MMLDFLLGMDTGFFSRGMLDSVCVCCEKDGIKQIFLRSVNNIPPLNYMRNLQWFYLLDTT